MSSRHRLLIVDDEKPLREGLKAFDWEGLGFEAIGCAAHGEAALEILKDQRVEVLLTDIRMPFLDGIELCRRAKVLQPGMKMILLTGHKDFEYARAAVGLGVTEYLLKPVNLDELSQLFRILKADLDEVSNPTPPVMPEGEPDSGLIPVVQAVLEGQGDLAFRRLRDLLSPLPSASPPSWEFFRLRIHRALVQVGAFVSSKLDPAPGLALPAPAADGSDGVTTLEGLWEGARTSLIKLTEASQPAPQSLAWAYVQKALVFLQQNLGSKVSMSQVAEHVGLTESYFSQIFKKETGVNFVDYLRDQRMARAIELMKTTDLRIYQIASAVGYDDAAYFAGAFRRCTGHTPLDFKRRFTGAST